MAALAEAPETANTEKVSEEVESEVTGTFTPVVQLEEVDVSNGEESEDIVFVKRSKLYRFGETMLDKGSGKKQWIERGIGEIKILKHKESQQQRLLMRQEKTMKIIVNALVDPRIVMTQNVGSDRAWVWSCFDYSGGEELIEEVFSLKFANADDAQKFNAAFEISKGQMAELHSTGDEEKAPEESVPESEEAPKSDADPVADLVNGVGDLSTADQ